MKKDSALNKKKYWLSLEQWSADKDFQKLAGQEKEFMNPLPSEEDATGLWERREFLQLMAASMALAGFGCVRRPTEKIVPYVKRPDDIILGEENIYSSSYYDGEEGFGILVRTREGRPVKIEGNKNHPLNQGGLSARAHSHILSLYDPERLKDPQRNLFNETKNNRESVRVQYSDADAEIVENIKKGKAAFLTGEWPSPTSERLLRNFCSLYSCSHFVWNPLSHSTLAEAQKICYGKTLVPHFALDRARFILSINCDFLGTWLYSTELNRLYSKGRKANRDMSRLVVFESLLSLTGTNADWRVRIKPSQQLELVLSIVHSLIKKGYVKEEKWPSNLKEPSNPYKSFHIDEKSWDQMISDLWENRGQSLVLAGDESSKEARSVQIAVSWLNHLLGNDGWTVDYVRPYRTWTWADRNIEKLIKKLETGQIDTLVIHKTNPLYSYPDKDRLEAAIKKAKMVVYTGDREDETGKQANYILPDHHDLEKWSDWEFQKGVLSIQQPTIRPLYRTRAFEDSLIEWSYLIKGSSGEKSTWYSYLKKKIKYNTEAGFSWDQLLKTGVHIRKFDQREKRSSARSFKSSAFTFIRNFRAKEQNKSDKEYELVLYSTSGLKDGTLANVSWLQEFPDPVTKICWDNYVCVSPADARKRNLKEGQMVLLRSSEQEKLTVPVHIQPGQADGVLAVALGYGRERA
jgi:molybdopterin-containing oxidoreductase family iron-sulfur binding subunit